MAAKKPVKVFRRDYLITDEIMIPAVDVNEQISRVLLWCKLKRVKNQSNLEHFGEKFSVDANQLRKIVSFRKLVSNLDQLLLDYRGN